jgi:hypothetical protein
MQDFVRERHFFISGRNRSRLFACVRGQVQINYAIERMLHIVGSVDLLAAQDQCCGVILLFEGPAAETQHQTLDFFGNDLPDLEGASRPIAACNCAHVIS